MLKRLGIESKFVNGLRYTDAETAEVVRMVLAGKINKALVNQLEACGGKAVGISGIDGHMLGCEKESEQLGYVGKITDIDIGIIEDCLKTGYIPVIATVGYDNRGNVYNINADTGRFRNRGGVAAGKYDFDDGIRGCWRIKITRSR